MTAIHISSMAEGFRVHTLANRQLSVAVMPEFGARVVSLKDSVSGREWLDGWEPAGGRRVWRPADPADFATGPGAGLDECLPTVAPCELDGARLPDHGELWNRSTPVDVDSGAGTISCRWRLDCLPLAFERVISLHDNRVRFSYQLENLAPGPTPFQWAWHPLFTFLDGDELWFADRPESCADPSGAVLGWPEHVPGCDLSGAAFGGAGPKWAKVFLGPLAHGKAGIRARDGATLTLAWPVEWLPWAGLWITRGAWKGLHHWAIEPTNVPVDRLVDAVAREDLRRFVWLEPGERRERWVDVQAGSGPRGERGAKA